jgi:hypothetical protein
MTKKTIDTEEVKYLKEYAKWEARVRNHKRDLKRFDGILQMFFSLHADDIIRRLERGEDVSGESRIEFQWDEIEKSTPKPKPSDDAEPKPKPKRMSWDERDLYALQQLVHELSLQYAHKLLVYENFFEEHPQFNKLWYKARRLFFRNKSFNEAMDRLQTQLASTKDPWTKNRLLEQIDYRRRTYHTF